MIALKRKTSYLLLLVVIVILVAGLYMWHHKNQTKDQSSVDANTVLITNLSKSNSLDDKRNLVSAYIAAGNYSLAESTLKDIASKSGDVKDYLGLINICTVRKVADKQQCVDEAISKIKPKINTLSFFEVYSVASELDDAGMGKSAVVFYQRAYDIYDPSRADAYTKSKEQIKQRIAELNG